MRHRSLAILSACSVLLLVLFLASSSGASRAAETQSHQQHEGHPQHGQVPGSGAFEDRRNTPMRVTIDGAITPELIPDSVAWGHFIRATASSATAEDVGRRQAFLSRAGLTPLEQDRYMQALGTVGAQLESIKQSQRAFGPTTSTSEMRGLKQAEERAVTEAEARLRSTLPAPAMAKLEAHIANHVKRRIKIYRGPMQ